MADITALPDTFRGKGAEPVSLGDSGAICADMLEAALPKWTEILGEEVDFPERETYILVAWADANDPIEVVFYEYPCELEGATHWRPLCSIDRPPMGDE